MKLKTALKIEQESFANRMTIRIKKGRDYANDEDCLQNFKKIAQLCAILNIDVTKSYGVALKDVLLKLDRLCNLIFRQGGRKPLNETIEDTINDLQNYIDLMKECLIDDYQTGD